MWKKLILVFNTVKYLRFKQIWHQVWHRIVGKNRKILMQRCQKRFPQNVSRDFKILLDGLDDSVAYRKRFDLEYLFAGEIELLHEKHKINWETWCVEEASHLWNYNLHYLEFMIPLALKYAETEEEKYYQFWKKVWMSWLNARASDSYEPYTISMRIPNVLVCREILKERIEQDTTFEKEILNQVYHEYYYLLKNQEVWLLGNHYWENLKTIILCSLLFGEEKIYARYFKKLERQIDEQILADGVHYERSMMYHKIIWEDCMRLAQGCASCGYTKEFHFLKGVIQLMLNAGYSLEEGMGRTPLFNDSGDNVAKPLEDLVKTCNKLWRLEPARKRNFKEAGYYRLDGESTTLLFDCGEFGPRYMLGHAHCDALSFELSLNGVPLFVNAGTGQYQGEHRAFFRSTEAHNTIMLDNRQQAELWGEHRAGRRGKSGGCIVSEQALEGEYISYEGDRYKRKIEWLSGSRLLIRDSVLKNSRNIEAKKIRAFYRLAPDFYYKMGENREKDIVHIYNVDDKLVAIMQFSMGREILIHKQDTLCLYADEFGKFEYCEVLEICNIAANIAENYVEIDFINKGEKV